MADQLSSLATRGILVINSNVSASNVASSDPVIGWGPPGGYVSQKGWGVWAKFESRDILYGIRDAVKIKKCKI